MRYLDIFYDRNVEMLKHEDKRDVRLIRNLYIDIDDRKYVFDTLLRVLFYASLFCLRCSAAAALSRMKFILIFTIV